MRIVNLDGNYPVSIINISGISDEEVLERYPNAVQTDFNFEQPLNCYRYNPDSGAFNLIAGWEDLIPPPEKAEFNVSPVHFKMLFTSAERVGLRTLRQSDPVIDDFFDLVDDPRTRHVDLAMQSVKDAVLYCLVELSKIGVVANDNVTPRYEAILTGEAN